MNRLIFLAVTAAMLMFANASVWGGPHFEHSDPPPAFLDYPPLLTESAAKQIRNVAAGIKPGKEWVVLVGTKPGGPAGWQYQLGFLDLDESTPWRIEQGVRVTVKEVNPGDLRGTRIEYDEVGKGFRFVAPDDQGKSDSGDGANDES